MASSLLYVVKRVEVEFMRNRLQVIEVTEVALSR
jgi:hypothetical protein